MRYLSPLLLICVAPSFVRAQTSQSLTIRQSTSGWCSPAIANVTGNVSITCIGVSPEALKVLNSELNESKKDAQERLIEANRWASRYQGLLEELKNGADPHSAEVRKLVDSGRLSEAEQLLRQSLHKQDRLLRRIKQPIARQHAQLAEVLFLELKASDALKEFKATYEIDGDIEFANKYADTLVSQHRCDEARPVYEAAIEQIPITATIKEDEKFQRFHALDGIELCEETAEQFGLAVNHSRDNLQLIGELAKNNKKYQAEYINTVMDYAQLERSLGHAAQAASLLSAIEPEIPQHPSSRKEQEERAAYFDISGATLLVLGDQDRAKTVYLEALKAYQQFDGLFSEEGRAGDLMSLGYLETLAGQRSEGEGYYKQAFYVVSEAAKTADWEESFLASILAGWGS